jgi:hypothetical protein
VPDQPLAAIGIEIEAVAAWFALRTVFALRLLNATRDQVWARPRSVWWFESAARLLWLGILIASGVTLIAGATGGFYLLAVANAVHVRFERLECLGCS